VALIVLAAATAVALIDALRARYGRRRGVHG
jgi:hypothetical protein